MPDLSLNNNQTESESTHTNWTLNYYVTKLTNQRFYTRGYCPAGYTDDGRVAQKPNYCDNSNKNEDIRQNLNCGNSTFLWFQRDKLVNDMLKISLLISSTSALNRKDHRICLDPCTFFFYWHVLNATWIYAFIVATGLTRRAFLQTQSEATTGFSIMSDYELFYFFFGGGVSKPVTILSVMRMPGILLYTLIAFWSLP